MKPNIPSNRSCGVVYIIPCKYEKIDELNRTICDLNDEITSRKNLMKDVTS